MSGTIRPVLICLLDKLLLLLSWNFASIIYREAIGAMIYKDYDKFLDHKMDVVIFINSFHQHASYVIQALKASNDIMGESTANKILAGRYRVGTATSINPRHY